MADQSGQSTQNGSGAGAAGEQGSTAQGGAQQGQGQQSQSSDVSQQKQQNTQQNSGAQSGGSQQSSNQNADDKGTGNTGKSGDGSISKRSLSTLKKDWEKEFTEQRVPQLIQEALDTRAAEEKIKNGDVDALKTEHLKATTKLTDLTSRYNTLSELVDESITTETENWPKQLADRDPLKRLGKGKYTVEQRLEWFRDSQELIPLLAGASQQTTDGGGNPNPPNAQGDKQTVDWDKWREQTATKSKQIVRF